MYKVYNCHNLNLTSIFLDISYLIESTNTPVNVSIMETIIKTTHIFNNIWIVSKPRVVKIFPKSDIVIIKIDIWNMQSDSLAKTLINRSFNMGSYITTIHGANMNLGVLQYKNCWKWGHTTFMCRIQGSKCIKYNRPYCHKLHSACISTTSGPIFTN